MNEHIYLHMMENKCAKINNYDPELRELLKSCTFNFQSGNKISEVWMFQEQLGNAFLLVMNLATCFVII